jgi:hypothetical protein
VGASNVNSVPGFVIGDLLLGWENANWGVSQRSGLELLE